MFDEEQAQFVCDFLECLTCSSGVPLRLMDWQRSMITEFYGQLIEDEDDPAGSYLRRYQYLYLEIAKKNGKSEIAAGLGVYHLFADGEINGEVYVVAADRDNAGIVFAAAKYMVEQSPALKKRSRIVDSVKTIYDATSGAGSRCCQARRTANTVTSRAASSLTSCTPSPIATCGTL